MPSECGFSASWYLSLQILTCLLQSIILPVLGPEILALPTTLGLLLPSRLQNELGFLFFFLCLSTLNHKCRSSALTMVIQHSNTDQTTWCLCVGAESKIGRVGSGSLQLNRLLTCEYNTVPSARCRQLASPGVSEYPHRNFLDPLLQVGLGAPPLL